MLYFFEQPEFELESFKEHEHSHESRGKILKVVYIKTVTMLVRQG